MMQKIFNNKLTKILWTTIKTLLTIFIIFLAGIIIVQRVSNNRLSIGGIKLFTIISESMVPKYEVYDMLIAKDVTPEELQKGDDLVYIGTVGDFEGKIITHQIIDIEQENGKYVFTTKGIANLESDPQVKEEQIYGKVLYKSKILSWCSKIINNQYGFYFIIFVPMVILIFQEVIKEVEMHKRKEK